ncbi:hypothetical protein KFE25_004496 [Diacronema lutheri]|uniref:Apple domain-containing protein n=1 Tax=Diacronema lutheri TaxID=2081491 RepID=A0A8J5X659_DIALT|nr:hypothetical protein KFE25_004496 [Diacronema lutheri]
MLPRARVAAACSATLVFVTVCALVALRGAAPAQLGAATAPAAIEKLLGSCDDQCRTAKTLFSTENWGNGYIIGTAPLCDVNCDDCGTGRKCFTADPTEQDYGKLCYNAPVNGKVCCCARTSALSAPPPPPAPVRSMRCADFCAEGGFGYGMVIGTAPACGASCGSDCGGECSTATDFFSDYGAGCATGSKRCCCARKTAAAEPTPRMPDHPSCNDWCLSAGYARGDIDGTSPACNGECEGAAACFLATDMLSDYGKSCFLGGSKRCRCWS